MDNNYLLGSQSGSGMAFWARCTQPIDIIYFFIIISIYYFCIQLCLPHVKVKPSNVLYDKVM